VNRKRRFVCAKQTSRDSFYSWFESRPHLLGCGLAYFSLNFNGGALVDIESSDRSYLCIPRRPVERVVMASAPVESLI
jgi:hypothetical protein